MKKLTVLLMTGVLALPLAGRTQINASNESVYYHLERNEPENSGITGIVVEPAVFDANRLNLNASGGIRFFYTYKSIFVFDAGYHYTYADNIKGQGQGGEPYGTVDSYGVPLEYKKGSTIELLAKTSMLSWEKEGYYHIDLGRLNYNTVAVGHVYGKIIKALTTRLGFLTNNRIIESEKGIPFKTNTPAYNYHYNDKTYTLEPDNLSTSSTMMQSSILVFGLGLTTFRDIKITLDDDRYKGRREEKSQSELFVDLLYAQQLKLHDMIYYHALNPLTEEYSHIPQRLDLSPTELTKIGARVGLQVTNIYKPWFGTKVLLEGGLRPGPKGDNIGQNAYFQLTIGFIFGGRIAL